MEVEAGDQINDSEEEDRESDASESVTAGRQDFEAKDENDDNDVSDDSQNEEETQQSSGDEEDEAEHEEYDDEE